MLYRPLIVYDSGVGGLTVARRLMKYCPGHDLIYLADNGWFPYGNKDEGLLARRVNELLSILEDHFEPRAIVVACNTASTAIADRLNHHNPVPIYGVIPPIMRAISVSAGGRVVLLATPATLERRIVKDLIATHNQGQISAIGSLDLVYMAEQKMANRQLIDGKRLVGVLEVLMPASVRDEVTTVILGCTHFPLLRPELSEAFTNVRFWLDPAAEVAAAVRRDLSPLARKQRSPSYSLLLTSRHNAVELARVFAAQGFSQVVQLESMLPLEGQEADYDLTESIFEGGSLLFDRHDFLGGYVSRHD
ncbi:MAG TPA: glutamate racemase [Blastocatellia bacterium]|nr:glutamate racemase [Blastocatellia bacterium]